MFNISHIKIMSGRLSNLFYRAHMDYPICRLLALFPLKPFLNHIWFSDFEYVDKNYGIYKRALRKNRIALEGKSIIEIGAGNSLGTGYFFLPECSSFTAIDLLRHPTMSKRAFINEVSIIDGIQKKYGINPRDYIDIDEEHGTIDYGSRARFLNLDITDAGQVFGKLARNQTDIILSMAVLEHLDREKVRDAINNMTDLLRPGGYMFHLIDLRDHFNLSYPFHFYKYSENQWNKLARGSVFYTNRLRAGDYEDIFDAAGLRIIEFRKESAELNLEEEKINTVFRRRSDLDLASAFFVVRKE